MNSEFPADKLIQWFQRHKREMPWRESDDPYHIWVSEVMLQQTRVDQAKPYFDRFIERFPTVYALAKASRQEVLNIWEGLGYYSRARHLHDAAKTVVEEYNGELPANYDQIIQLKGVGPYTAAAVLSIAFNEPHAAVDGNIIRVISRYYGIEEDVRSAKTRNKIQETANQIIDRNRPGDFNQALMELGAQVCLPRKPKCETCPLNPGCTAYSQVKTEVIPYKSKAKAKPHHHIGVAVIVNDREEVLVALRPEDAMLGGMWEFPGGKKREGESIRETTRRECREELGVEIETCQKITEIDHAYSHFKITLHAFLSRIKKGTPAPRDSQKIEWVPLNKLEDYPFPKANRQLIDQLTDQRPVIQKTMNL